MQDIINHIKQSDVSPESKRVTETFKQKKGTCSFLFYRNHFVGGMD